MRVLVCGGRDYPNHILVWTTLDALFGLSDEVLLPPLGAVIIHGGAGSVIEVEGRKKVIGADLIAREWAICNWVPDEEYLPDWNTHGKAAGPIRNQKMLDEGKPDLVVAFPGGRGTADMVRRAEKAQIPVIHPK